MQNPDPIKQRFRLYNPIEPNMHPKVFAYQDDIIVLGKTFEEQRELKPDFQKTERRQTKTKSWQMQVISKLVQIPRLFSRKKMALELIKFSQ